MNLSTRRLVLSTVGISLLNAHQTPQERSERGRWLINLANEATLSPEDEEIVEELATRVEGTLASGDIGLIRRKSAELNGLYALYEDQIERAKQDVHILVATDTALGRRCAALVEAHLRQLGVGVFDYVPDRLTAANTVAFEAGSKALIHWCAETIPPYSEQGYTVVFNLVAAFKALQGYLNTIGMFYADQILYLFQGETTEPILIPRLPIKIDLERLEPFAVRLAMMAEGDAIVPVTALEGLSRALYDHDGDDAVISQWGLLTWQQIKADILGGDLLTFPRLQYERSFLRDAQGVNASERARLQAVLARVATLLEESEGNTALLKQQGGIRYDNYVGKRLDNRPIGHFRISQGIRVSCLAENGGLTLRHFGAHDYVNDNP